MSSKTYFQTRLGPSQLTLTRFIEPGSRVLEMGCATGYMTRYLKEKLNCRVVAVEINPNETEEARKSAEQLIIGDITHESTWENIPGSFDYVTYADVLEHLADPWQTLKKTKTLLNPNGSVLASVPNIAYYKIRKELLFGRFNYTDSGILDDTHLRFYTEKTLRQLFDTSGLKIRELIRIHQKKTDRRLSWLCPNAFAYQFVVQASPRPDVGDRDTN